MLEPGAGGEDVDEVQAVCDAVGELCGEGPGDILVFLAGEREIKDTAEALLKPGFSDLEVLPLFGRLSSAEQHRIFEPHAGRRAVLGYQRRRNFSHSAWHPLCRRPRAAPASPGTAAGRRSSGCRSSPFHRPLPTSAAGRCGRLGPGVCIRLYSGDDFSARRPFTEPEILRTNLASVVLQMAAIGLGEVEDFPFMDAPDRRNIKDGIALLEEIGVLVTPGEGRSEADIGGRQLTQVGRELAKLPVDPRHGRMVLEAERLGCLEEVLVIVSALSVQDPRERPAEKRDAAAACMPVSTTNAQTSSGT